MDDVRPRLRIQKPRFLQQLRAAMRQRNLAYATEQTYVHWIRAFIRYHRMRHPAEMGAAEVDEYLSWLAVRRRVAPGTQAIALNALVFLYHKFLEQPLGDPLVEMQMASPLPRTRAAKV